MTVHIQYGTAVRSLPAIPADILARATAADLRLLILLTDPSVPGTAAGMDALCTALAAPAGCSPLEVATSLAFWRGAGILSLDETAAAAPAVASTAPATPAAPAPGGEASPTRKHPDTSTLPHYTTAEIADLLAARADTAACLDECANLWGKMLNTTEINDILGLTEYLGLDWDYIFALIAYCARELEGSTGGRSTRYVVKRALSFYDEDVRTYEALTERIKRLEAMRSTEGKLRRLLGIGERALTPREKKAFSTWIYDLGYDLPVIEMAYNTTIDNRGAFNLSYMSTILKNWHEAGYKTPEEVEAAQDTYRREHEGERKPATRRKRQSEPAPAGSFDTNDFFEAAVRRSLGVSSEELAETLTTGDRT